ncbi:hypothetical protein AB0C34_16930 [Nocardia sp. NPDC049220]|uniref:hypothetical protein n=1 Tax=Nocardia sp. NPDC049220 TaxID=3155273 RepID=UPI0033E5DEAF
MSAPFADWATPGTTVYELHCSTRDYSTKKIVTATVTRVDNDRIVLANGVRYRPSEGATFDGLTSYHRDDPANKNRYFLLVGPDDPRTNQQ